MKFGRTEWLKCMQFTERYTKVKLARYAGADAEVGAPLLQFGPGD